MPERKHSFFRRCFLSLTIFPFSLQCTVPPFHRFWCKHQNFDLISLQAFIKNSSEEAGESKRIQNWQSENVKWAAAALAVHRPLPLKFHWWALSLPTWRALLVWNTPDPFIFSLCVNYFPHRLQETSFTLNDSLLQIWSLFTSAYHSTDFCFCQCNCRITWTTRSLGPSRPS